MAVDYGRVRVIDGVIREPSMDKTSKKDDVNSAEELEPQHDSA